MNCTYIADIKLIAGVRVAEEVVGRRTRWRRCVQSLPGHRHTDLTWNGRCTESGFVFAVLETAHKKSLHVICPTILRTSRMNTGRPSKDCSESSRIAR